LPRPLRSGRLIPPQPVNRAPRASTSLRPQRRPSVAALDETRPSKRGGTQRSAVSSSDLAQLPGNPGLHPRKIPNLISGSFSALRSGRRNNGTANLLTAFRPFLYFRSTPKFYRSISLWHSQLAPKHLILPFPPRRRMDRAQSG